MKFNKLLPFILVGAILVVLPLTLYLTRQEQDIRQQAAPATTITLTPTTSTVAPGQQFPVTVAMNAGDPTAGGNRVTGAELHMTYDATKFTVASVALPQNPLLPTLDIADTSVPGKIDIYLLSDVTVGLATPAPGVVTGSLITVTFQAISTTTAPSAITLTPDSEIAAIGEDIGTNVLTGVTPASVSVVAASPTPTPVATPTPAPTLTVTLTATPATGTAPLNNVDLTATLGGTATGTATYNYDCTNDGTIDLTISSAVSPHTAADLCDFPTAGTFTARVQVLRQGVTAANTRVITVSVPPIATPTPTPVASPTPVPSPDTTPPTVTITAPPAGALVSGITTISATATDNVGVQRVDFFVDGVLKGTDIIFPYAYDWDTTNGGTHACGGAHTHSLTARAYDDATNNTVTAPRVVNMNNPSYCASPVPTPVASPINSPSPSPVNNPPAITTTSMPNGVVGQTYSSSVQGSDPNLGDTLSLQVTNLPSGLTSGPCGGSTNPNTVGCTISGTPTSAGTFQVNAALSDGRGGSDTAVLPLVIAPAPTPTPTPQPTPSPVPTPSPGTVTTISLLSEGIDEPHADQKLFNFIFIETGTTAQISLPGVVMAAGAGGVFTNVGTISTPPFVPGTYDVYVSGPAHLTKKFAGVPIGSGANTIDLMPIDPLTGFPMYILTADIVDNNTIDLGDYNALISGFGCRLTPLYTPVGKDCSTFRADLDLDARVSIHDYAYLVTNYTKQGEVAP